MFGNVLPLKVPRRRLPSEGGRRGGDRGVDAGGVARDRDIVQRQFAEEMAFVQDRLSLRQSELDLAAGEEDDVLGDVRGVVRDSLQVPQGPRQVERVPDPLRLAPHVLDGLPEDLPEQAVRLVEADYCRALFAPKRLDDAGEDLVGGDSAPWHRLLQRVCDEGKHGLARVVVPAVDVDGNRVVRVLRKLGEHVLCRRRLSRAGAAEDEQVFRALSFGRGLEAGRDFLQLLFIRVNYSLNRTKMF